MRDMTFFGIALCVVLSIWGITGLAQMAVSSNRETERRQLEVDDNIVEEGRKIGVDGLPFGLNPYYSHWDTIREGQLWDKGWGVGAAERVKAGKRPGSMKRAVYTFSHSEKI